MNKRNKQLQILLSFCLVVFVTISKAQTLTFHAYGAMDKPMPNIELITKNVDSLTFKFEAVKRDNIVMYIYYVDTATFNSVYNIVKEKELDSEVVDSNRYNSSYPFGSYRISYNEGEKSFEYMLVGQKKTYKFFKFLLAFTRSNAPLHHDLEDLLEYLSRE